MVNSFIARSDLDTEMTVVRNEMESGENNPGRILLQQTMATMYQWHNYGNSIIGARSMSRTSTSAACRPFYREYYQPDNATLIVSGRFDPRPGAGLDGVVLRRHSETAAFDAPDLHAGSRSRTASAR